MNDCNCQCDKCGEVFGPSDGEVREQERMRAENKALRAERDALAKWQLEVAEGMGYVNHAEGQDGYEVASAQTILDAWQYVTREHADSHIDLVEQLEEAEAWQENAERDRAKTKRANETLARWLSEATEERDAARGNLALALEGHDREMAELREKLTAPCHGLGCGRCESCVSAARADAERLREALDSVVSRCRLECSQDSYCDICGIALAALPATPAVAVDLVPGAEVTRLTPAAKREWHGCTDPKGHTFDEGVCHCGLNLDDSTPALRDADYLARLLLRARVSELEAALLGMLLRDEMGCACDEPELGPCEWHVLTANARKLLEVKP
jgi:hypothetical protein